MARAASKAAEDDRDRAWPSNAGSRPRGRTPTTSSSGRAATPSSATPRPPPSSSAASSSPRPGRRTRPTSSPRSTSAASPARPSARPPSRRWSTASPARIAGLGPRGRLLRDRRRRRRLRGRADLDPGQPEGRLQLAGLVQRRLAQEARSARPASSSAVEDDMDSILGWNTKEGVIFKGGSGSGINLSKIRGSNEPLSKGGIASGPVSFMRGADSWAGAIKSGGGTRRAAKMVVLDVDHPDIEKFIWCKADEEKKAAALRDAGFDMRLDSEAFALGPVPERQQLGPRQRRVHAGRRRRQRLGADQPGRRLGRREAEGARAARRDRRRRLAVRRSGRPVRLDHQPLAHLPRVGPDQRVEPVLGVHARRRLGLQPRLAEPDEVPQRGRDASTSTTSPTPWTSSSWRRRSSSAPRATRPSRSARTRASSASSAWATPTSARC